MKRINGYGERLTFAKSWMRRSPACGIPSKPTRMAKLRLEPSSGQQVKQRPWVGKHPSFVKQRLN
jgi:hypothetical protein